MIDLTTLAAAKAYTDKQRLAYDESVTIEWDGNTEGKVTVANGIFAKISDLTPEPSDLIGGKLVTSFWDNETEYTLTEECIVDNRSNGLPLLVVDYKECDGVDGVVYVAYGAFATTNAGMSITVAEPGVYFLSAKLEGVPYFAKRLTYNSIKKLDQKYLPDGVGGGLPVVELSTVLSAEFALLTETEIAQMDAVAENDTPITVKFSDGNVTYIALMNKIYAVVAEGTVAVYTSYVFVDGYIPYVLSIIYEGAWLGRFIPASEVQNG